MRSCRCSGGDGLWVALKQETAFSSPSDRHRHARRRHHIAGPRERRERLASRTLGVNITDVPEIGHVSHLNVDRIGTTVAEAEMLGPSAEQTLLADGEFGA